MRARKRFGQNFLHDPGVIQRLVELIDPRPDDRMVEIGPGRGALTLPLLQRLDRLQVIELDRDLIPLLQGLTTGVAGAGELTIHQADALRVDYAKLAQGQPLRLVGNLPYNISTPLMFHLLASKAEIQDMHFMLQREVVDRLVAEPGSASYGRLTVAVAARASAERVLRVGPGAFTPAPKVESAVVRLRPRPPQFDLPDVAAFEHIVTQAFSQRRKTLRNSLSGVLAAEDFARAGIDPGLRAQALTPADFARLAACAGPAGE